MQATDRRKCCRCRFRAVCEHDDRENYWRGLAGPPRRELAEFAFYVKPTPQINEGRVRMPPKYHGDLERFETGDA